MNDEKFSQKCNLREQISYLRKSGADEQIPKLQLKLDRLHECMGGESTAEALKNGSAIVINWPEFDSRFGFCLDKQVEDILKVKVNDWGFENQTYEPADDMQLIDVLYHKIEVLRLGRYGEEKLGDLVYAYSWDGRQYTYWRWDEKNCDFLIPLKQQPLLWRECDEDEAYRILAVQRNCNDADYTKYVFGYFLTAKIGDRILRDMVNAARFGLQKIFVEWVLAPVLRRIAWKRDFMDVVMVRTHGGRDFGCEGWNIEKRTFSVPNSGWDFDTQRWLGFTTDLELYPKEEGIHPVWVPESLAYLIMNAVSDINLDAMEINNLTQHPPSELAQYVEYYGFQIETFCGLQFGRVLEADETRITKTFKLKRPFRGFNVAKCDFTTLHKRLYRITLLQAWYADEDSAIWELHLTKNILSEKYGVAFEKLPRFFHEKGAILKKGERLIKRTADSSGTLRLASKSQFVLFGEHGRYQFAIYFKKHDQDSHTTLCLTVEDLNIYGRDDEELARRWRVINAKLHDNDGMDVL